MSIANEIERLTNAKAGIKTALEGKGVTVPANAKLDEYGNLVNSIESGVDTTDADAIASDIVKNKTAYVNGVKVTGSMKEEYSLNKGYDEIVVNNEDNRLYLKAFLNLSSDKHYINPHTEVAVSAPFDILDSELGITANKILSGNTIIGVEGTATSDANAIASDIIKDKTAYVNGQKVTGTLATAVNLKVKTANSTVRNSSIDQRVYFDNLPWGTQLVGDSTEIRVGANWDNLANNIGLAANRIKAGVTILGIEGTVQEGTTADKTIQAEDAELETVQEVVGNNDIGLSIISTPLTQSKLYEQGSIVEMHPTFEQLATVLGITPEKIKAGEIICGVEGTYAG